MNKKEYAESFIEAIKNKEENLYRFFTKRTIITSLNEQKNLTLDEFLIFIKENLQKEDFIIKRTFESASSVYSIPAAANSFLTSSVIFLRLTSTKGARCVRVIDWPPY